LLSSVLPHLEPGTLVHIHDMLLPDDYPTNGRRGYNEQSGTRRCGQRRLAASSPAIGPSPNGVSVAKSAIAGLALPPGPRKPGSGSNGAPRS